MTDHDYGTIGEIDFFAFYDPYGMLLTTVLTKKEPSVDDR